MKQLFRKIKNHFGLDAPGDIYFRYLARPKRAYNILKYVLYRNRKLVKLPYLPMTLMVEVSTQCNLQCPGCERQLYRADSNIGGIPKETVTLEKVKRLKRILPYIYSTYFVGGLGEPLLNKEFWDIHRFFKGFRMMTGYVSNGMLITEEIVKRTIDEDVNRVLISIDSCVKEKYERIKKNASFEKAVEVVEMFARYKKRLAANRFQIGLNYILRSDNYDEVSDYLDFAHSLGVEYIMFTSFITHIDQEKEKSFFLVDDAVKEELLRKAGEKAKQLGISIRLPKVAPSPGCICNWMWHGVCVFYNGDVCACPFFRTEREFYYYTTDDQRLIYDKRNCKDTILGNYLNDSFFSEIWNGSKARAMREAELSGDSGLNPCGSCYYKHDLH